jgi:hypothetical protein
MTNGLLDKIPAWLKSLWDMEEIPLGHGRWKKSLWDMENES